jgi:hypothetical protein
MHVAHPTAPAHRTRRQRQPRALRPLLLLPLFVLAACDIPTGLPKIESRYLFPVEDLVVPVTGVAASATTEQDFSDIDLTDRVNGAVIRVAPDNPAGATGTLTFTIAGGGETASAAVNVAGGEQRIDLDAAQTRAFLGSRVTITASGTLCRSSGCGFLPPPFPQVTLKNRIELLVQFGGEG